MSKISGLEKGGGVRIDQDAQYEQPPQKEIPSPEPVRGQGGHHRKPTLATFSLEGKTALVTGAGGLGLVMAQGLMTSGANIAMVDLNEDAAKQSVTTMVETFKRENPGVESIPKATAHRCDVSDPASVDAAIESVLATHSKIDILLTSAGFTENFPATSYPFSRVRALWGVNVDGTWLFATAVAKHLMERKAPGSIIMIGSMSGAIINIPQPQSPYNASKAAVRHLAASLAVEWAAQGIRVNCVSPGYMETALTKKILDDKPELREKWTSLTPMGRLGNPEDLQGVVVWLASDASLYVTGADIRVDGGYTVA